MCGAQSNNVFTAGFRTTPSDSTGAPHILEHTVLCGSQRYPTRDPFFKMLYRSLANYMNALTASDWTAYPFATTNRQDFYNLLGVRPPLLVLSPFPSNRFHHLSSRGGWRKPGVECAMQCTRARVTSDVVDSSAVQAQPPSSLPRSTHAVVF